MNRVFFFISEIVFCRFYSLSLVSLVSLYLSLFFLLSSSPKSLKLEALLFLRLSMDKHPPFVFHPTIKDTIQHVTACVKEDWYKASLLLCCWSCSFTAQDLLSISMPGIHACLVFVVV